MKRNHHLDMLGALLLFCVFAACVLGILLTGAGLYRRLTERDQASYDRRTGSQYIATRVRQADRLGSVAVEEFGGTDALALEDEYGYVTRVYWHDGWLMELYAAAGAEFSPEDGEKLMPADGLALSLEGRLLRVEFAGEEAFSLCLRSGEGAAA